MAIMNGLKNEGLTQLGTRSDFCYLCARELKAKNEREYTKSFNELKGKLEGKKCVKILTNGTTITICLDHIHKIASENPKEEE